MSERPRLLEKADDMLASKPRTVTADQSERSEGGQHDFYSEGDYWWPVPGKPNAPYEQRDGQTNPNNFVAHRLSMMRLADHIGTLVSAWKLTGNAAYSDAALRHLNAWFVAPETKMVPRLLYAQAIKGRHTGRSIGLIDTLHLVEVARGAKLLIDGNAVPETEATAIRQWFGDYSTWMNTHPYGIEERDWYNNHSIAWSLQVAAFADLAGDKGLMHLVRKKYKTVYLPTMMDENGGFPKELSRTKPYGYSLFVIDLMAGIAQIASTPDDNLWEFTTPNGRSMALGINFLFPYVADKSKWPYDKDIQYWDDWPVRHPFLLLGGLAKKRCDLVELAMSLPAESEVYEVRRNWPLRHPLIWMR
ncbi:alginate lyase family protein [Parasphingorhabdus cellanae]|uniref:Alginate lyase family protein n=1 Tax=Parasphingorhabdus cellanae TaxID=2806553 RepID=A0ABX7T2S0_9SPHN|nr:alginate lyase family protein [Parasphingorhabdus cellanae]QTD55855.1 alginate lyase family protein [Parasphingorhabdus cellanae]